MRGGSRRLSKLVVDFLMAGKGVDSKAWVVIDPKTYSGADSKSLVVKAPSIHAELIR